MKRIKVKLIEIYKKLFEDLDKCPKCGAKPSYVGLNSFDCSNSECEHSPDYEKSKSTPKPSGHQRVSWTRSPAEKKFLTDLTQKANRMYGPKWKDDVDRVQGWLGAADHLLDQFWYQGWPIDQSAVPGIAQGVTAGALEEIAFFFDQSIFGSAGAHYTSMKIVKGKWTLKQHEYYDARTQDYVKSPLRT